MMIGHLLLSHVNERGLGEVHGEAGCILQRSPATVRGPDVAFFAIERAEAQDQEEWFEGGPDLVVEVLSPSNRRSEVMVKVGQYLGAPLELGCRKSPQLGGLRGFSGSRVRYGRPTKTGSGWRVIPKREATVSWMRVFKASTSRAVAPPRLMIASVWFSERPTQPSS